MVGAPLISLLLVGSSSHAAKAFWVTEESQKVKMLRKYKFQHFDYFSFHACANKFKRINFDIEASKFRSWWCDGMETFFCVARIAPPVTDDCAYKGLVMWINHIFFVIMEENITGKLLSLSLDMFFKILLFRIAFLILFSITVFLHTLFRLGCYCSM